MSFKLSLRSKFFGAVGAGVKGDLSFKRVHFRIITSMDQLLMRPKLLHSWTGICTNCAADVPPITLHRMHPGHVVVQNRLPRTCEVTEETNERLPSCK